MKGSGSRLKRIGKPLVIIHLLLHCVLHGVERERERERGRGVGEEREKEGGRRERGGGRER